MRRLFLPVLALGLVLPLTAADAAPGKKRPAAAAAKIDPALSAAVADSRRDADRARDQYRKPAETLTFFQVAPDMKVGEYAPGGEWYSRLLGLYLGPKGKLVGLYFDPTSGAFNEKSQQGIRDGAAKYASDIATWSGQPAERFTALTLDAVPAAEKGTFDRILIMRMMHNLMRWNIADREIKAMRELLKPDGMVGIEQHRARADAPYSYSDGSKGYLREADVIRFMELNGFTYVGKSQANANPKDPANWPDGVWTLPPAMRGAKEEDKARLRAIGESDRMTLLFRKRP
ncbi:methyltransferase [Novosphingobium sp.]|uniref:class I SAM-dependent methyltransferase n=1 Tax=Novosphingobium sp. TaxID=1874826 RepID=UPI001ED61C38|nr:methyltransferase [Novosphingobium sp.]MBK6800206.1 class I SAM-dependent methyltransferase [Novosphingobium sp.]MBK9010777.1 class I SAM-dependent methyltransferase [Novosphingobium sp.]